MSEVVEIKEPEFPPPAELDIAVAAALGFVPVRVDYTGSEFETPEQREHAELLDAAGVESIGWYWVNAERRFVKPAVEAQYFRRHPYADPSAEAEWFEPWAPSTDRGQAMKLMEVYRISLIAPLPGRLTWSALDRSGIERVGDTPMEAVCLAVIASFNRGYTGILQSAIVQVVSPEKPAK